MIKSANCHLERDPLCEDIVNDCVQSLQAGREDKVNVEAIKLAINTQLYSGTYTKYSINVWMLCGVYIIVRQRDIGI